MAVSTVLVGEGLQLSLFAKMNFCSQVVGSKESLSEWRDWCLFINMNSSLHSVVSVGICSAQVPVFISEMAPPSKRGRLVGAQQWAITWGIMIMFYISYGCSFIKGTAAFRVPWALQMIPAIILFIGMMFLPESPRWLARKDRWEECLDVLTLVHGKGDRNSPFVAQEYDEIKAYCEIERQNADVTYWELFSKRNINRTHIGISCQVWSQLTGMNVMMYYITYVFAVSFTLCK